MIFFAGPDVASSLEGVGRAVNESVVASLVAVFFVNIVYTQLLGTFPNLDVFR